MIPSFTFSRIPSIHFEAGGFQKLPELIAGCGKKALIVTGGQSLESSGKKKLLQESLEKIKVVFHFISVSGEPSPEIVDNIVSRFKDFCPDVVCAVGGGSVIDTGKAVSAMLLNDDSVFEYLEGTGTGKKHDGVKVPFIAVPTTSGTGSEATRNAVLSRTGRNGFKKSLRHDNFVPDTAVIDPELTLSCPPSITASSGMDAFCQLLESYVSTAAAPITDALAYSGLKYASENLVKACTDGKENIEARAGMAYAALISGITLANAGLGVVHGLASSIGGLFDIPHGVICGTLLGSAAEVTIEKLKRDRDTGEKALMKYARVGALLAGSETGTVFKKCSDLIRILGEWTEQLNIPRLGEFGVSKSDIESILDLTANKNNPVKLDRIEISQIIESRL